MCLVCVPDQVCWKKKKNKPNTRRKREGSTDRPSGKRKQRGGCGGWREAARKPYVRPTKICVVSSSRRQQPGQPAKSPTICENQTFFASEFSNGNSLFSLLILPQRPGSDDPRERERDGEPTTGHKICSKTPLYMLRYLFSSKHSARTCPDKRSNPKNIKPKNALLQVGKGKVQVVL